MSRPRFYLTWRTPAGVLHAIEPDATEIARHAPALTAAYNEPANARMLGHTEAMTEADTRDAYHQMFADGGYSFLVFRDGTLVADGDLRHVTAEAAEMAFLVTDVSTQGQGLGTRVATLLHAFGFRQLGLQRIFASILPINVASRRVFEKLGHTLDDTPAGRAYAEEPGDLVTVVDRATFERALSGQLSELRIEPRAT